MVFFDILFISIIEEMENEKANNKILDFFRSNYFQKIFYPCIYFLMAIGVVITGCFVFSRSYYTNVYVSGNSMSPTLLGGDSLSHNRCHYGISDNHRNTLKTLKRYDVVVTYYPKSWGSTADEAYKIKRVWGFPGETLKMSFKDNVYTFEVSKGDEIIYSINAEVSTKEFNIVDNKVNYTVAAFSIPTKTFYTRVKLESGDYQRTNFDISLKENEYFLMGDNWTSSSDSYNHKDNVNRITFDDLQGKMVCIQGTAIYKNGELQDRQKIKDWYYF